MELVAMNGNNYGDAIIRCTWCYRKTQKVVHLTYLKPFTVESPCLRKNVRQRLLSANECKLFVNDKHSLLSRWNTFTFQQDGAPSHRSKHSDLSARKYSRLHRAIKLAISTRRI